MTPAPENPPAVPRSAMSLAEKKRVGQLISSAFNRLEAAGQFYRPESIAGLLSGGHDSLTATYLAFRYYTETRGPRFFAAHIDTGIGVHETQHFVMETCAEHGIPLKIYRAMDNCRADGSPDPQDYSQMVRERGFPGPGMHWKMYQRLKLRQIERLVRENKIRYGRRPVLLVSGRRSQESARRKQNTVEHERTPVAAWVNPIHDFSKDDCRLIIDHYSLRRNPVVAFLHKSGECLCGAFAKPGELAELRMWYPAAAARIDALHAEIKGRFPWNWEEAPPSSRTLRYVPAEKYQSEMALCHNCNVLAARTQPKPTP